MPYYAFVVQRRRAIKAIEIRSSEIQRLAFRGSLAGVLGVNSMGPGAARSERALALVGLAISSAMCGPSRRVAPRPDASGAIVMPRPALPAQR